MPKLFTYIYNHRDFLSKSLASLQMSFTPGLQYVCAAQENEYSGDPVKICGQPPNSATTLNCSSVFLTV